MEKEKAKRRTIKRTVVWSSEIQITTKRKKKEIKRMKGDQIDDHSGRAVLGMNCLRSFKHWDRGFESHSRHGSLSAFLLCLCCSM
jgi:hypothetical protein